MIGWIKGLLGRSKEAHRTDEPKAKVWTPADVITDDPHHAAMIAAVMNSGKMMIGEVDENGELHIRESDG